MCIKNKKAFTLIEMLVVVVIIAILAAIALPQYQKVLEKAKSAEAVTYVRALANAEKLYYLANNEYTTDPAKLDIQLKDFTAATGFGYLGYTKDFDYYLRDGSAMEARRKVELNKQYSIMYFLYFDGFGKDMFFCIANGSDNFPKQSCAAIGKVVPCTSVASWLDNSRTCSLI
jgi:prepilin-type N-terminal cleavage/methylation domain-containing protein